MSDCIFCDLANREVIAEFDHCYAIFDQFPVSQGHTLLIPYKHTENWFTASDEIRADLVHALNIMKSRLDVKYAPGGYNIGMNCGPIAGQTVMHLHVHLIPRYEGDMKDPRGGIRGVIPDKQKY
ncbi:MAG: HIT family protein [Simkaniaceae bacterium]|nr:HIT family protein [Simkaniaceae bacterium]